MGKIEIPINYLELNWLNKKDKTIPLPLILFDKVLSSSGIYYAPEKKEILVNERYYPLDKGLIIVHLKSDNEKIYY